MLDKPKRGRPTRDGSAAVGHIHLRTTLERKGAYVRAARPRKLAEWMTAELDRASGYSTNTNKT